MTRALALVLLLAAPAQAGPVTCALHPAMTAALAGQYGETPQGIGLTLDQEGRPFLMTIYGDMGDGSWTLTLTGPTGTSCIAFFGADFKTIPEPVKGDPA